jgi:hypothetical protein
VHDVSEPAISGWIRRHAPLLAAAGYLAAAMIILIVVSLARSH